MSPNLEDLTPEQKQKYVKGIKDMEHFLSKDLSEYLVTRVLRFTGNFDTLESAIGALVVGQLVGWRVLFLIHSPKTIRNYQRVLDLDFKGTLPWDDKTIVMPEEGVFARKSLAFEIYKKIGNFWKVVRGQTDEITSSSERKASQPLP